MSVACLQLTYCGCSREGECCKIRCCPCFRLSLCCSKACKCGDRCRNDKNTAAVVIEALSITLIRWKSHGALVKYNILCLWFISMYFWFKLRSNKRKFSLFTWKILTHGKCYIAWKRYRMTENMISLHHVTHHS